MNEIIRFLRPMALLLFIAVNMFPFLSAASLPKLILTTQPYAMKSDNEFTCFGGRIHGYITLAAPVTGTHTLESIWIGPDGVVEGTSKSNLEFSNSPGQTAYIWFQFGKESGSLSSVNNQEISDSQMNGSWRVMVKWDDKDLIQRQFQVKC